MMSSVIFQDYDRTTLDSLLDPRVPVPDFKEYTTRFERLSQTTRAQLHCDLDVNYGDSERERLDVFTPRVSTPVPVNVFFHGGYWRSSDKERYSFIANSFVENNAACILVEYALTPSVTLDTIIRQCRQALAFIYHHASNWNIDREHLFVSGHSAGGQIVGMLMADRWHNDFDVPVDLIRGGCGISGLYELEPIRLSYLNADVRLDESSAQANSPAALRPATDAPLIAAVGAREGREFLRQNASIATAWSETVSTLVLPNGNHYSAVESLGNPLSPLSNAVLKQMELDS